MTPPRVVRSVTPASLSRGTLAGATLMRTTGMLGAALALGWATPAALAGFKMTIVYKGTVSQGVKDSVQAAADYWNTQITGYKEGVTLSGFTVEVEMAALTGGTLANAGPTDSSSQAGTVFTTAGHSNISTGFYSNITTKDDGLVSTMTHELGHTLGIGTWWETNHLYDSNGPTGTVNGEPVGEYTGANALAAWKDEFNQPNATYVPVEKGGGSGTNDAHWNEGNGGGATGYISKYTGKDFNQEMMTGWGGGGGEFVSNVTLGSLMDLGYIIGVPTEGAPDADYLLQKGTYFSVLNNSATHPQRKMTKISAGTVTLMAANTYSGGSFLQAGTLVAGSTTALGTGAVFLTGATLDVGALDLTTGAITLTAGAIIATPDASGHVGTLTAPSFALQSGTVSATLAGAGSVTKSTSGTVMLNAANTYIGDTTISAGKLIVTNAGALSTGPVTISGGTLDVGSTALTGIAALHLAGGTVSGTTGSVALASGNFDLQAGTVSATLTGASDLAKTTTGTVTLNAVNTYIGGTTISAGKLIVTNARALSTGAVTVATGGTLDIGSTALTGIASLTVSGGTVSGTTGSITASSFDIRSGTVAATLAGSATLTKTTADRATLAGVNTYTKGTIIAAGTLVASGASSLGSGDITFTGGTLALRDASAAAKATVNLSAGALTFENGLTTATLGALSGSAVLILANTTGGALALTVGANNTASTYGGALTGAGSLTKAGSGKMTLTGASAYKGGTTVSAGTLEARNASALGAGIVTVDGGILDVAGTPLAGTTTVSLRSGTIRGVGGAITASAYDVQSGLVSVSIGGTGALAKTTDGAVNLTAANTYTGGTTVSAGKLIVGHASALSTGAVTVSGGTLDVLKSVTTMGALVLDSGTISGAASLTAPSFELRSGLVSTRLMGAASVSKTTTGTVTLSGANGFTGGLTVNAGTVVAATSGALSTGAVTVASGGVLRMGDGTTAFGSNWTGGEIAVAAGGRIEIALASTTTISRAITGDGDFVQNGAGTTTLTNAPYTGSTTVNAGRLILSASALPTGTFATGPAGTMEIAGDGAVHDLSKNIAGTGGVAFSGAGTTRLHGAFTYTGETTVGAGHTLTLGSVTGETLALASSRLTLDAGATLRGSGTIAGSLRSAGTIAPGFSPGTITVAGDFTTTGTLAMEVAPSGAHDEIRYGGQAFLGGTLNVTLLGGVAPAKGTLIALLVDSDTTDGRPSFVGNFTTVNVPIGSGVVFNTGTTLQFLSGGQLNDIPGANIAPRILPAALAVSIASASNPPIAAVVGPSVLPVASMAGTFFGIAPLGYAALVAMPEAQAERDGDELRRHLDARRFERNTTADYGLSPYVSANGMSFTGATGNDAPAFNFDSFGGLVGLDQRAGADMTVGAQIGYDSGNAHFHANTGKADQQHLRVTVYGSKMITSRLYADAGLSGGMSTYDVRRDTVMGRNSASTHGYEMGGFISTGMILPLDNDVSLTPHAGLTYTRATVSGFGETGSPLALTVKDFHHDSLSARVGATFNAATSMGDMPLRLGFDVSFVHELLGNETDIAADFAGTPTGGFTTKAVVRPGDRLEVGPELDLGVAHNQSITLAYRLEYGFGDATGHRVDAGYRLRF